ncbi:MAG: steroid 5-alpha reductase [Desulfuromonas sp.]|nr:MAG: steroid 5-alpha reductase [Desulfuromonas sp.]
MATFLIASILVLVYMTLIFCFALTIKDNSVVDIFYGTAFLVGCWGSYLIYGSGHPRQWLILLLLTIWGLRLAIHLFFKKRGHEEDFRYRKWREEWGETFVWRSFLQIFMLQGLVVVAVSTPALLVVTSPGETLGWPDLVGTFIWFFGFFFEALGDWQLLRFKSDPANRGKIMRYGLWKTTRHPNYFGEALLWWGIFLIGLGASQGMIGIVSPLLIGFLLLKVSGIPMLEEKYEGNPEFELYRKQTNAFFPWFPGRGG